MRGKLSVLDVSHNELEHLNWLRCDLMLGLEMLYISHNRLKELPHAVRSPNFPMRCLRTEGGRRMRTWRASKRKQRINGKRQRRRSRGQRGEERETRERERDARESEREGATACEICWFVVLCAVSQDPPP